MDQRATQAQSLRHALGERIDRLVDQVSQLGEIEHPFNRFSSRCSTEPVGPGEEVEVLGDVHVRVAAERVRHETQNPPHSVRLVDHRFTAYQRIPGGWQVERRQDPHRGGLAGPVGTDETQHLAGMRRKRNIVDGTQRPEEPVQVPDLDRWRRWWRFATVFGFVGHD